MKLPCPNFEDHTQAPEGYIQWHAWAEKMSKTHRQIKCAGCGKFAIWEPKLEGSVLDAGWAGDWQNDTPSDRRVPHP